MLKNKNLMFKKSGTMLRQIYYTLKPVLQGKIVIFCVFCKNKNFFIQLQNFCRGFYENICEEKIFCKKFLKKMALKCAEKYLRLAIKRYFCTNDQKRQYFHQILKK